MESKDNSKQIRLKVLTPLRVVFDKPVDFVILKSREGDVGILYGHEPYAAILDYGSIRIFTDRKSNHKGNGEELLVVMGGVVRVYNNEVVVLSDLAEHPDRLQDIINRIEEEKAENKLRERKIDLDTRRAELAIRNALVNMDVSTYPILQEHGEITGS